MELPIMKEKFKSVTVYFTMHRGAENRNKIQRFPICEDCLSTLNNDNSKTIKAINEAIRHITYLCGYENFEISSIEGVIFGGDKE